MSAAKRLIIAFDLYGTLLSTESIAEELAKHFGDEKAQSVATTWRKYQLEYTWRLNSMRQYQPFNEVTLNSLHHSLAEHGLSLQEHDVESLMKAYDSLSTFPDVKKTLEALSSKSYIAAVVFSNGTDSMVTNSVKLSPDLGPHASVFADIITVDEPKCFKPDPAVYHHLAKKLGKGTSEKDMRSIWLVSGNPFDVVGARAVGMNACWVDRSGQGWTDKLSGAPTAIVKGLEEVVEAVEKFS